MKPKKKIKFKILNRENPEIERLRQHTFEVAKKKVTGRVGEGEDLKELHINPLLIKEREDVLKDLDYSLSIIPKRHKPKSKTGWERL